MGFQSKNLILEELPITNTKVKWKLKEQVVYTLEDTQEQILVPKGFSTDLASIPRTLWVFYAPFGKYSRAAVVHDYLYRTQTKTRKESDKIFYKAMKDDGVATGIRHQVYLMVRLFGWFAWNKNKKISKLP